MAMTRKMSLTVCRAKMLFIQRVRIPFGNYRSNRSNRGGDEAVEAFGVEGPIKKE
jgi:hypothetical protein